MAKMLHEQFGSGAKHKRLPEWAFTMSKDLTEEIVRAYVNGDGYTYRSGRYLRACTISVQLAQGMAMLANKLGWACSINIGKPLAPRFIHKNKRITNVMQPLIDVLMRCSEMRQSKTWFKDGFQWSTVKKVERKIGKGCVHNLEVAIDNSYVTPQGAVHNCYHEHTSYLSLKAMEWLLRDSPFHLHKVLRFPIHGGAIAIMLRHNQSGVTPHESVSEMLAAENITEKTWKDFSDAARNRIWGLDELVKRLKGDGKTVVGYGASAKATVWLNALKFTRKEIAFVCDSTPQKQNRFVPGTDIPVVDPGALTRELPNYSICWAWNFFPEIEAKETIFKREGGRWIVPIPTLKIVPHDNSPDLRFPQSVVV